MHCIINLRGLFFSVRVREAMSGGGDTNWRPACWVALEESGSLDSSSIGTIGTVIFFLLVSVPWASFKQSEPRSTSAFHRNAGKTSPYDLPKVKPVPFSQTNDLKIKSDTRSDESDESCETFFFSPFWHDLLLKSIPKSKEPFCWLILLSKGKQEYSPSVSHGPTGLNCCKLFCSTASKDRWSRELIIILIPN